jgi:hypothetical protein
MKAKSMKGKTVEVIEYRLQEFMKTDFILLWLWSIHQIIVTGK